MNDATPGHHHSADPAALEDPVHHDVAEHELHEEQEPPAPEPGGDEPADRADPADPADSANSDSADSADSGEPPAVASTGDDRVDLAVARLGETAQSPPAEHVAIYEDVHRRLQDTLADLDGS